ncbi:MAG: hypothetical protein KKD44_29455 [Proteobacteria bacterium]|nr:hypothetical protein [Pseudomonadota bacterium]
MANIVNQYGIDAAGNVARTNIVGTNYTVPASRRLLITDFGMDSEPVGTARVFFQDVTGGVDLDDLYLPAAGTIHRTYGTPIEVAAAHVLNLDYIQGVAGQISLFFHGILET